MFEADLKIVHDILLAVDDKDAILNMEKLLNQPLH
jgi:hypothetical protein